MSCSIYYTAERNTPLTDTERISAFMTEYRKILLYLRVQQNFITARVSMDGDFILCRHSMEQDIRLEFSDRLIII